MADSLRTQSYRYADCIKNGGNTCTLTNDRKPVHDRKPVRWMKMWEFCFAALALIELWSCFSWSRGHYHALQVPVAIQKQNIYSSASEMSSKELVEGPTSAQAHEKLGTSLTGERNIEASVSPGWSWRKINSESGNSWKIFFDRIFMSALFLHALIDSWSRASTFSTSEHLKVQDFKAQGRSPEDNDPRKARSARQGLQDRCLPYWQCLLVFVGFLVLHIFFLPLLSRGSEFVPIKTRQTMLSSIRGFFSRRKQNVSHTIHENYVNTAKTYSIFEDFATRLSKHIRASVSPALRANIRMFKRRLSKRMAKLAVRHPLHFKLRLTQVFAFIRWAKFLAPLVGASNKLRGNLQDFLDKWRLRQRKRRASRAWSVVLGSTTAQQRGEDAASRIIENFRSKKCQKMMQDLLETDELETAAVTKIQALLRARMAEECVQNKRARKRLFGLKKRWISAEQRREAMELKKEIRERSRANRKLLLRPNSAFSVTWKIIAITCVALEVAQSVLAPRISGKMEKLPLEHMLEALLSSQNSTQRAPMRSGRLYGPHVLPFARKWASRAVVCTSSGVSTMATIWRTLVQCFLRKFVVVVEIVCFLDVFITFFTGEFDKTTGVLVPKPFFKRWILPGVALQLLVNPAMSKVCNLVKQLLHVAADVGPTRVARVLIALQPLAELLILCATDLAFFLVQKANRKVVTSIFNR